MLRAALAVTALSMMAQTAVLAQSYPSKPIRVIIPITVGAGVDIIVRKAAEDLLPKLGQPLVVENRAGGAMVIAAEACARAAPDGYTLCSLSPDALSIAPHVFNKLAYDPEKDLRPIVNMYFLLEGLFVKSGLPVNSVKELIAYEQARSGTLNFGTLGPGSNSDMNRQDLNQLLKTNFAGIPYKGGNLVINALVAGEIDVGKIGAYNAIGPIKAGKVKLLAIAGTKRSPVVPEVPTFAEAGVSDPGARAFWGILGPGGLPDAIVRRLNNEFVQLFKEPKFAAFVDALIVEVATGTPEEFAAFLRRDREEAGARVRKYNLPKQ
jgi:tripartite-type tricarboxylate transporter receptor subunit TctC